MADSAIAVTAGSGTNVDTRTEGTNGNHRQVVVLGDPATNAGVAPVDGTNGLAVQIIPALPAGTNNIGDVDVLSVPSDPFGANADAASATGSISAKLRFIASTGIPVTGTVTVGSHAVTNAGTFAVQAASAGDVAHSSTDSGNPVKVGHKALAHGSNPTAVDAAERTDWYANRHGIPWVIGGHPNVITRSATIDDADGAQTDASLLTVSAGNKIVVTAISATCSSSNSGSVAFRIGFGTASVPAASEGGTAGVLLEGKFAAGGGHSIGNGSGILGIGADNEDLRITCDDPAGGSLFVRFSYYTVES